NTQWSPFPANTDCFGPSQKDYMFNYIVEHMEELVAELKAKGVQVLDDIAAYEYGKFVQIMDPEAGHLHLTWHTGKNAK
ncbi:MAG: hypothetical protein LHW54_02900, partial [Candidatus Cloacimonetes bacterium]|nr:hypothetical protein [Candidatus Cloacimonadota bacterium]